MLVRSLAHEHRHSELYTAHIPEHHYDAVEWHVESADRGMLGDAGEPQTKRAKVGTAEYMGVRSLQAEARL